MSEDADRSEEATAHKLAEARKQGSVARSTDMGALAVLAALTLTLFGSGWSIAQSTARLQLRLIGAIGHGQWRADVVAVWLGQLLVAMLGLLAPLFMAVVLCAVLVGILQTGMVFTFHPLKPDLERLNPSAGLKRFFSLRILYESGKSILKLSMLCATLYWFIKGRMPGMLGLVNANPAAYMAQFLGLAGQLLVKLVCVMLVIGLLDGGFSRWDFGRRMRMSKRDIKDEAKNRDGDPRIRARLRQLRHEAARRSKGIAKVADADVLITNPTHLAVALRYRRGEDAAPEMVAKGAGEAARAMRALAVRHRVPIVQNKALARALFRAAQLDQAVPADFYPSLAKIMVWVFTMRDASRAQESL